LEPIFVGFLPTEEDDKRKLAQGIDKLFYKSIDMRGL
jgi:hypothetical protein